MHERNKSRPPLKTGAGGHKLHFKPCKANILCSVDVVRCTIQFSSLNAETVHVNLGILNFPFVVSVVSDCDYIRFSVHSHYEKGIYDNDTMIEIFQRKMMFDSTFILLYQKLFFLKKPFNFCSTAIEFCLSSFQPQSSGWWSRGPTQRHAAACRGHTGCRWGERHCCWEKPRRRTLWENGRTNCWDDMEKTR